MEEKVSLMVDPEMLLYGAIVLLIGLYLGTLVGQLTQPTRDKVRRAERAADLAYAQEMMAD